MGERARRFPPPTTQPSEATKAPAGATPAPATQPAPPTSTPAPAAAAQPSGQKVKIAISHIGGGSQDGSDKSYRMKQLRAAFPAVATQCVSYVGDRARRPVAGPQEAALFLSESPPNRAEPLSIWTWSKVVARLADEAGVWRFTTHTPRHLRLTDLARAGWTATAISRFAGHSRSGLAQPYLALASRHPEPTGKTLEVRAEQLAEVLFRAG